jgi:hypothetical protein
VTLAGVRGSLVGRDFVERALAARFAGRLGESERDSAARRFARWWHAASARLGPASGLRALFDTGAAPLAALLGFRTTAVRLAAPAALGLATLVSDEGARAALVVAGWEVDLGRVWEDAVREGLRREARWCLAFNGPHLRLVDGERTYARRFVEFDLAAAAEQPSLFAVMWGLLRAAAFAPDPATRGARALLDEIVEASDLHAAGVRRSLQSGVETALVQLLQVFAAASPPRRVPGGGAPRPDRLLDASLAVVYRLLFLLFAEARALVPVWHPIYREGYSVAALQARAEASSRPRGLWAALEAISRLAQAGCSAGDLQVTPFDGPLFDPAELPAPWGRRRRAGLADADAALGRVLLALTTRPAGPGGRERIAYADLGVEQLGAVYERVLDCEPAIAPAPPGPPRVTLVPSGRRKATGTFYTPRSVTDFLVRRTLAPLVREASPEAILALRVLDPAMGSGAFLVAACRYLAAAYERAVVAEGRYAADDVTEADRSAWRRLVAQRCLYGVDLNPTAVQLARLSLWLATLAADRPLTFLDHHLRAGDSLVGASLVDLARRPPGGRRAPRRDASRPLFETPEFAAAVGDTWTPRTHLALDPDDSVASVRCKARLVERLAGDQAPLARWRRLADLWCAAWFWPERAQAPGAAEFAALADVCLGRASPLAPRVAAARLETAQAVAARRRFFHWTLEFPEVFYDAAGRLLPAGGFDAVVGNPPWDMVRRDSSRPRQVRRGAGHEGARGHDGETPASRGQTDERDEARLLRFARDSGVYRLQGDGHANLYQLFLERALQLVRPGGRLGLVLPGGLLTDGGSAPLRAALFERADVEHLVTLDNAGGIFPIHRSYRFALVVATTGGPTRGARCRFGVRSMDVLDRWPDTTSPDALDAPAVVVTPALLRHLSGPTLGVPELRHPIDLAIAEKAASVAVPLGDARGWGARFGRELNASEDRPQFGPPGRGLPVVEGKHLEPFRVRVERARFSLAERAAARRLAWAASFGRPRLAYRDVASATNRLTLIAAIVPAGVVTTHTVSCLKTPLPLEAQQCLCALLNSYVANYLVRQRVGTHVTAATIAHVPVPRPPVGSPAFVELGHLAASLATEPDDARASARLQAIAARLYGLSRDELVHVLGTFPLVPPAARAAVVEAFETLWA